MIRTIKTKQFKITAALLALILTVSCILWNTARVHASEVQIDNANVQTFAGAKLIANGKLAGTDQEAATMSVFVTGGSADKYNYSNVKWMHGGTSWVSESKMLYEGTGSAQKIYACSPYVADANDGVITVTASEQVDRLVATATDLTSGAVDLQMTHALTKLVLVPTFGTEVTSQTITSVEVGGMYATGDLKISDNSWSNLSEANATLEMTNNEVLVIPMASCASFDVVITMEDNRVFTTTVTCPDGKLEGGTQYNIKLQVGQDKVTIGGITAEPWGSPVDSGMLETE